MHDPGLHPVPSRAETGRGAWKSGFDAFSKRFLMHTGAVCKQVLVLSLVCQGTPVCAEGHGTLLGTSSTKRHFQIERSENICLNMESSIQPKKKKNTNQNKKPK